MVLIVGLGLVPWGVLLWLFARRDPVRTSEAWTAVLGDVAWVGGTLVLIFGFSSALNATGNAIAVLVGMMVAAFGMLEFVGIKRLG